VIERSHAASPTLTAAPAAVRAWAYDRRLHNRRPVFRLEHRLQAEQGRLVLQRRWFGCGPACVSDETVHWQAGLLASRGELTSLAEQTQATVQGRQVQTVLSSHRTGGQPRERAWAVPHAPVTLASLPLFIGQHWPALVAGQRLHASYLVLKVQRSATVRVQREDDGADGTLCLAVTPVNPLLRLLFGSTRFHFAAAAAGTTVPRLWAIEGLLDPRDRAPRGRWREYLGRIEFEAPVDLSPALPTAEARP
jgi:hypothetical protein